MRGTNEIGTWLDQVTDAARLVRPFANRKAIELGNTGLAVALEDPTWKTLV
jgi:hypothetical protein